MTGQAKVQPASSDKWKAPQVPLIYALSTVLSSVLDGDGTVIPIRAKSANHIIERRGKPVKADKRVRGRTFQNISTNKPVSSFL